MMKVLFGCLGNPPELPHVPNWRMKDLFGLGNSPELPHFPAWRMNQMIQTKSAGTSSCPKAEDDGGIGLGVGEIRWKVSSSRTRSQKEIRITNKKKRRNKNKEEQGDEVHDASKPLETYKLPMAVLINYDVNIYVPT